MLASEIREMADADIRTRVAELEEERFRLTFRGATEQLEEPLRLRSIRRDIARMKTVLREREVTASAVPAATPGGAKKKKKSATAGK
jgi:large subunit ribosomal protein L29